MTTNTKNKGIGLQNKLMILIGILFVTVMAAGMGIVADDISDTQSLIIDESKNLGNILVEIEKIKFYDRYAIVFLSVENLGSDEAHVNETGAYVIQGETQFQTTIPKPSGASRDWINGSNIPPQTIREGVIFIDTWNSTEPFELILDGSYIKQDPSGGLLKDVKFVFSVGANN